jgi:hypothetical protein
MKDRELPSYGTAKEALHENISTTERYPPDDLKKWLTEERKQRDERKDTGRRQKEGYERKAKERSSGNIQTQNRVYEGHPRPQDGSGQQSTIPLSIDRGIVDCFIYTPIYPAYCRNAKKLRTRERTWT